MGCRLNAGGTKTTEAPEAGQGEAMAVYVLIDRLSVTDPDRFGDYSVLAKAAVTRHGGRYVLPYGTQIEALEGNWTPNRIVLIEFEDAAQARKWWHSPEYAEARTIHQEATISNVILVDDLAC
jgi:uncharacterized protein (DUF1330 family)